MARAKTSKICLKCSRVLPLNQFYSNKAWAQQSYHDAWCRECAGRYCKDQESLKRYCFENNRKWDDSYWDMAQKKAQYFLSNNGTYLTASYEQRKKLEDEAACRQFYTLMNMKAIYTFVDNVKTNDVFDDEKLRDRDDDKTLHYDKKWRGYFTNDQIDTLEQIYSQYEQDFNLDNVNIRDYARKVAKASLNADIAEDKMRRGQISAGQYKEAQKIFDDLSKSSNFAACRRKPGQNAGMGSLGDIILKLQTGGYLGDENPYVFPSDDVDAVISDYRHTIAAVGLEL